MNKLFFQKEGLGLGEYRIISPYQPYLRVGLLTLFLDDVMQTLQWESIVNKESGGGNVTDIDYLENDMDEIFDSFDPEEAGVLLLPHAEVARLLHEWKDLMLKRVEYITVSEENGNFILQGSSDLPPEVVEYRQNNPQEKW